MDKQRKTKTFWNIIKTILAIPAGIIGAICLVPFAVFALIICLPVSLVEDIWTPDMSIYKKEEK